MGNGCLEVLSKELRAIHEKKCPRRTVQCFILHCEEDNLVMEGLKDHLKKQHRHIHIYNLPSYIYDAYLGLERYTPDDPEWHEPDWTCSHSAFHLPENEDLIFYFEYVRQGSNWFFWIYVNGEHADAEKFSFTISFMLEINFAYRSLKAYYSAIKQGLTPGPVLQPQCQLKSFKIPVFSTLTPYIDVIKHGSILKFTDQFLCDELRDPEYDGFIKAKIKLCNK